MRLGCELGFLNRPPSDVKHGLRLIEVELPREYRSGQFLQTKEANMPRTEVAIHQAPALLQTTMVAESMKSSDVVLTHINSSRRHVFTLLEHRIWCIGIYHGAFFQQKLGAAKC
jgi:hypothetical protein